MGRPIDSALTSEELALALRVALERAGAGGSRARAAQQDRCSERDLPVRPTPAVVRPVAQDYQTRGVRLTAIYSNCSGKHAGMLALARHHGWPTEFYTRLEHPVQQRCLAEVKPLDGSPGRRIRTAVDGCGSWCYGMR